MSPATSIMLSLAAWQDRLGMGDFAFSECDRLSRIRSQVEPDDLRKEGGL